MNFLKSLRSDLLSRPVLPLLIVVCLGLASAVVYVAGAGGSNSSTSGSVPLVSSGATAAKSGLSAASEVTTSPTVAVSETTSGTRYQNQGSAHDPFKEQPQAAPSKTSTSSASSGSKSSTGSTPAAGTTGVSGTTPSSSTTPKPPAKHKTTPKPAYIVSLLAGFAPSPGQPVNLTSYPEVKVGDKLPSKTDSRLVFMRVNSSGTAAIFKLLVPPILHGSAKCLPSPENCEEIEIPAKQTEQLEYAEPNGQTTLYEIGVVSITKLSSKAAAARAHAASNSPGHHRHHRHKHRSK